MMRTSLTESGLRRLTFAEEGPSLVTSAVIEASDGARFPVPFLPDPEPASRGRTRVIIGAPPGGCHMTGAELLAEDGTAIFRVDGHAILSPGDHLTIGISLDPTSI